MYSGPTTLPSDIEEQVNDLTYPPQYIDRIQIQHDEEGRITYFLDYETREVLASASREQINDPCFDLWADIIRQIGRRFHKAADVLGWAQDRYCGGRF